MPSTPLFDAVLNRDIEGVKALVRIHRVNTNETSCGRLPLIRATNDNSITIVQLLLENERTRVDACEDGSQNTALWYAVNKGFHEIARLLKKAGADASMTGESGMSPLGTAYSKNDRGMINLLSS
jgi:ankyrin repeat protein